jgi:hypothetical protein
VQPTLHHVVGVLLQCAIQAWFSTEATSSHVSMSALCRPSPLDDARIHNRSSFPAVIRELHESNGFTRPRFFSIWRLMMHKPCGADAAHPPASARITAMLVGLPIRLAHPAARLHRRTLEGLTAWAASYRPRSVGALALA